MSIIPHFQKEATVFFIFRRGSTCVAFPAGIRYNDCGKDADSDGEDIPVFHQDPTADPAGRPRCTGTRWHPAFDQGALCAAFDHPRDVLPAFFFDDGGAADTGRGPAQRTGERAACIS